VRFIYALRCDLEFVLPSEYTTLCAGFRFTEVLNKIWVGYDLPQTGRISLDIQSYGIEFVF
jgi:hypothetical protein